MVIMFLRDCSSRLLKSRRRNSLKRKLASFRIPGQNQREGEEMMKSVLLAMAALASLAGTACITDVRINASSTAVGQTNTVQQQIRQVKGQTLTSTEMPAVRLKFDKQFKYVGGHEFILYDVARAEQHFFVDADKEGRVRRLYWIQFEGYLPSNTHTYNYKVNQTVKIGGLDFIADAYARNIKANPGRPDSDGSRARAFLESKGYRLLSDDVMSQRLVHIVDDSKRSELMIIYLEDLSAMKLTAADLAAGGSAAARWNEISKGLLERAVKGMEVKR
jgi:hypothetical protein